MIVPDLRDTIRSVKARVNAPVTYADVLGILAALPRRRPSDVDFVTVHSAALRLGGRSGPRAPRMRRACRRQPAADGHRASGQGDP